MEHKFKEMSLMINDKPFGLFWGQAEVLRELDGELFIPTLIIDSEEKDELGDPKFITIQWNEKEPDLAFLFANITKQILDDPAVHERMREEAA